MADVEGRYLHNEHEGDDEDNEEDEERNQEGLDNSEWFDWTTNIVHLSEKLNRDVDQITEMPYVSFLFWSNYFKLKYEQEYRKQ